MRRGVAAQKAGEADLARVALNRDEPDHAATRTGQAQGQLRTAPVVSAPVDDLGHGERRRRTSLWLVGLGVLLVATLPVAVGLGPIGISPQTVAAIVSRP